MARRLPSAPRDDWALDFIESGTALGEYLKPLAVKWLQEEPSLSAKHLKRRAITILLGGYVPSLGPDVSPSDLFNSDIQLPAFSTCVDHLVEGGQHYRSSLNNSANLFFWWVIWNYHAFEDWRGIKRLPPGFRNPVAPLAVSGQGLPTKPRRFDPEMQWLLDMAPDVDGLRADGVAWLRGSETGIPLKKHVVRVVIADWVIGLGLPRDSRVLLRRGAKLPPFTSVLENLTDASQANYVNSARAFLEYVLLANYGEEQPDGSIVPPVDLAVPIAPLSQAGGLRRSLNRADDTQFLFLRDIDLGFENLRELQAEWFGLQQSNRPNKHLALSWFCQRVLQRHGLAKSPDALLRGDPIPSEIVLAGLGKNKENACEFNNHVHDFFEWVIATRYTSSGSQGGVTRRKGITNPVRRIDGGFGHRSETAQPILPYRYVLLARNLLAEGRNFRDWTWAQAAMPGGGDWIDVEPSAIDPSDKDCVYRVRDVQRGAKVVTITQVWSPVRAVAVLLKLLLPLRTFQVRMLDSGEADTYRYVRGAWEPNESPLATGTQKKLVEKGVFRRSRDYHSAEEMTALFINTNKTADIDLPEAERGYVLRWQHEEALYWLEKLRDFQEKWNPLEAPTGWNELESRHFGRSRPHLEVLQARGGCCFLFRDASENRLSERRKPITNGRVQTLWYRLLAHLEAECERRNERLSSGEALRFTDEESRRGLFPLHSLRASLITALYVDGGVPMWVLSRMIIGHKTLRMSFYYTKPGTARVSTVMREAEGRMREFAERQLEYAIRDASYDRLSSTFASAYEEAFKIAAQQETVAGFVFDDKGICAMGGAACDRGGEKIGGSAGRPIHAPVPGFPAEKNCVRCRFFLSGPAFLLGLKAHFDLKSYQVFMSAERYRKLEHQVQKLEDERAAMSELPALQVAGGELQRASRNRESAAQLVDSQMHDLHATAQLIERSLELIRRNPSDYPELVAVGDPSDLKIAFEELDSEFGLLQTICEEWVHYPSGEADMVVARRSQLLDRMLDLNGSRPVFLHLTAEQQLAVGNQLVNLIRVRSGDVDQTVDFVQGKRLLAELGLLEPIDELLAGSRAERSGGSLEAPS